MSEPTTARDQVARLLALVPLVNTKGELSLQQASEILKVPARQLKKDVELLFMCGLPGGMPDDLIDVDYDALDQDGMIRVSNADYLNRPLRLTATEATALMVALRTLRAGANVATCEVIDRALTKLDRAAGGALPVEPGAEPDSAPSPDVLAVVRGALADGRQLRLVYHAFSTDQTSTRAVDPHGIFTDHGKMYLDAWCHRAESPRSFRIDRIREAEMLAAPVATVANPEELTASLFTRAEGLTKVTLLLEEAASWAVEYYPIEAIRPREDGGLEVDIQIADVEWFDRLMLRLTPHAKIIGPPHFATRFAEVVQSTLNLYG